MRLIAFLTMYRYSPAWLLLANLIPIAYVLFFDWKVVTVIALYWMENIIVGIMNVVKMITIMIKKKVWLEGILILLFICGYGVFTAIHGMFVNILFESGMQVNEAGQRAFYLLPWLWEQPLFLAGIASLFIHHFASYLIHFIGGGEYKEREMGKQVSAPCDRMMALHFVVLCGGFMMEEMGGPIWYLVFLVAIKIVIDLSVHIKLHAPIMVKIRNTGQVLP